MVYNIIMKLKGLYGRTFGNWNSAYSGSVADIPPAIVSWTALLTVTACLAVAGDETLNDGRVIDKLTGDSAGGITKEAHPQHPQRAGQAALGPHGQQALPPHPGGTDRP